MEPVEPNLFHWIKKGLSASDGSMDDARIHAGLLVLTYVGIGIVGACRVESANLAAFVGAWAAGGGVLAGGIGSWFGLRKDN